MALPSGVSAGESSAAKPRETGSRGINSARPPRVCYDCAAGRSPGSRGAGLAPRLQESPSHAGLLAQWI
ncbi:hypothetical protein C4K27_3879 [Pseudomonas chlororaphis subsp. chlororaphis]|nr:hypothetical protein C4K27_3879 [Pseudomonas chlororaphis subsp. chlororaphis]